MLGEGPTLSNNTLFDNRELRALSVNEDGGKAPSSLRFSPAGGKMGSLYKVEGGYLCRHKVKGTFGSRKYKKLNIFVLCS